MRKKTLTVAVAAIMAMAMSITAFASGWQPTSDGRWWYGTNDDNSTWYAGEWQWIDGKCYYFYDDGYMAADTSIDGYDVNADGAWIENGEVVTNGVASDNGSALPSSGVMPYKAIMDQYSDEDYGLLLEYLDDKIIEGEDYYEFPDCKMTVIKYYDPALIEGKKVGDYIFVNGYDHQILNIFDYSNGYTYDFGYEDELAMGMAKRDKGYICIGMDEYTERMTVYEGPVRFRKDATIITGGNEVTTPIQSYFFDLAVSDFYNRQYGYITEYDFRDGVFDYYPVIKLDGYIKSDDQGYINWYKEIYYY